MCFAEVDHILVLLKNRLGRSEAIQGLVEFVLAAQIAAAVQPATSLVKLVASPAEGLFAGSDILRGPLGLPDQQLGVR